MSELEERPREPLRYRSAEVVGVSFPERIIELVVIPYERETIVPHPRENRLITEVISRGAFDGIERRANRVKVNRDHKAERTVGKAVSFHPSREEGLVSKVRISRTPLGDETLELAEDEVLDASAGFAPLGQHGELWETRNRCRIHKAFLGHIALVPEAAYEDARVLAVRSAGELEQEAATPNLELIELDRWRRLEAELDRRYHRK
jgi:HK97 family phage prohead protease